MSGGTLFTGGHYSLRHRTASDEKLGVGLGTRLGQGEVGIDVHPKGESSLEVPGLEV